MIKFVFCERDSNTVQQATLCFLMRKNNGEAEVLFAMKKRGFGEGLWNGVGGKVDGGETIKEAAIREAYEEIGVRIESLERAALLHFYFPEDPQKAGWNQDVHVFLVNDWEGEPTETEEMKPEWFVLNKIPYEKMWDADREWVSRVLVGENIECWIAFDDNNKAIGYKAETYVE